VIEIGGALIATVATDGATSELLAEEVEVTVTEDGVSETTTQIFADTASETSPLGKVAGYTSLGAGAVQTAKDCSSSLNATCLLDLGTLGVGGVPQFLDISDLTKALFGLGASIPAITPLGDEASKC
jgi:hypothetical protein